MQKTKRWMKRVIIPILFKNAKLENRLNFAGKRKTLRISLLLLVYFWLEKTCNQKLYIRQFV